MIKVLVLVVIALSFSACQKNAAENVNISSLPVISLTPTPSLNSAIGKIDFKNFTFPWTKGLASKDKKTFMLRNGEIPFEQKGRMGVSLGKTEYADVTNDGEDEALITLSIQTGGSSTPNIVYIYELENKKTKLLWSFDTGDRAIGGFKNVYSENGSLIVELFGDDKFENDEWKFNYPKSKFKGDCCPTAFTKFRFKWNGKKFVLDGNPELFDYDWKIRLVKN